MKEGEEDIHRGELATRKKQSLNWLFKKMREL